MAFRKATLRQMSPTTRQVARLQGEIASVARRLKSVLEDVKKLEEADMARRESMEKVLTRMTESNQLKD